MKHILLVNATDEKNLPKIVEIKKLNLFLTLIGDSLPEWIKPYVDSYIVSDLKDYPGTLSKLEVYYGKKPFDGVITFWDREVEITAIIADNFKLPGPSVTSIRNAKNKLLMRIALSKSEINQVGYYQVGSLEDLKYAAKNLGYPLIFKPVGASCSAGVFKIESDIELKNIYNVVTSLEKPEYWLYSTQYIAEEYMQGDEFSIEGVINNGLVYIGGITKKWKTEPGFIEWQHCFPADLPKEVESNIIKYVGLCISAIELNNTAFHIEVIVNQGEVKVVEVNARLGGDFITSYLLPLCGVNIAKYAILTALGEKIDLDKTNEYSCVRFKLAEKSGQIKRVVVTSTLSEGVVKFGLLKEVNDIVLLPPDNISDNRLCYVITHAETSEKCMRVAEESLDLIEFDIDDRVDCFNLIKLNEILKKVSPRFDMEVSGHHELYADFGLDSREFLTVLREIEMTFNFRINDEDLLGAELITANDLICFVNKLTKNDTVYNNDITQ